MKVYGSEDRSAVANGIARHLLESLSYNRHEVYLVSPWTTEVPLAVGELGHFASVLGGHFDEIFLTDLLARVAERHTLYVVTRPPEELVDLSQLRLLQEKTHHFQAVTSEEGNDDFPIFSRVAATLRTEIEQLVRELRRHQATYTFGKELEGHGAKVHYLPRLHAKVLWSPIGVFIGSANFTYSGFYNNEELVLEVTDDAAHHALYEQVRSLTRRAIPRRNYRLLPALKRNGFDDEGMFFLLADHPFFKDYPDFKDFLHELSSLV